MYKHTLIKTLVGILACAVLVSTSYAASQPRYPVYGWQVRCSVDSFTDVRRCPITASDGKYLFIISKIEEFPRYFNFSITDIAISGRSNYSLDPSILIRVDQNEAIDLANHYFGNSGEGSVYYTIDQEIINQMKAGLELRMRINPSHEPRQDITLSLSGFTYSFDRMLQIRQ